MLNWVQKKKQTITMSMLVLSVLIGLFIVALTFNFIGNSITSTNLILGFTFGFAAVIAGIAMIVLLQKKKELLNLTFFISIGIMILLLVSIITGSMGYLGKV